MRPTVLAGLPGCGKTTFAMRFAELAGVQWEIYSCAGVHDSRFAGTARGWSSGEPAFPTSLVVSSAIANPVVILDEIEKAGGSSKNGDLLEALLPMLEPRSAAKFFDVFIEASVDLSGVIFIGTANDPERLPRPLRDRCRILTFPSPERSHLSGLVPGFLKSIIATSGMDPRWVQALTADEFETLAAAWPGGSLRALQRMIEAVRRARDHAKEYH
jgi:ATP-dependent Lon protease